MTEFVRLACSCIANEYCGVKDMSRYTRPDIGKNNLSYKGRRYWFVEIVPDGEFEGWEKSDYDYVLYDCLIGAVIAFDCAT